MTKIKICGITNMGDAEKAASLGADALGFVFAESPRRIAPKDAKPIIEKLKGKALSVGVFVDEPIDRVREIIKLCSLDVIQLHGDEDPHYCEQLKGRQLIKAFRIKDASTLSTIGCYKDVFAYLLDTFSEQGYGGTGVAFDWSLAVKAKSYGKPIILSGGLGAHNVKEAIKVVTPYAVDISSSIEIKPGKKDHILMKKVIDLVKSLDGSLLS